MGLQFICGRHMVRTSAEQSFRTEEVQKELNLNDRESSTGFPIV